MLNSFKTACQPTEEFIRLRESTTNNPPMGLELSYIIEARNEIYPQNLTSSDLERIRLDEQSDNFYFL
jgi:hypothetical protein